VGKAGCSEVGGILHKTRDGKEIKLSDLTDDHLRNILRMHHRIANEGVVVGSIYLGDVYADKIYGKDVLWRLRHHHYVTEARCRGLKDGCVCVRCNDAQVEECVNAALYGVL